MVNFLIGLFLGLFLGAIFGMFLTALCSVAKNSDNRMERIFKENGNNK